MNERQLLYTPDYDKPREKCAIFGIYGDQSAANITFYGLMELQHRGQDSSGIAAANGEAMKVHKATGLVVHAFDDPDVINDTLSGHLAIGHNRYKTSGNMDPRHMQPVHQPDNAFALAHNGNISNLQYLEQFLDETGIPSSDLNDSEMMFEAINYYKGKGARLTEAVHAALPLFVGAYSIVAMDEKDLVAARDPKGIRPLSLGKLNGGYVVASETCAFVGVGADFIRDIQPGEMVTINEEGLSSYQAEKSDQKLDIFELIYFARPDSMLLGKRVQLVRDQLGRQLAMEQPADADIVVGVPNSGTPAGIGYAEQSGIPYKQGLIRNPYSSRTFIKPNEKIRAREADFKYKIIPELVEGQRVVVVDDSIVRGLTTPIVVKRLFEAGAKEVHVRSASSEVKYPDYYGVDTATQEELIAANMSIPEMREVFGVNSLGYISTEGMLQAIGLPAELLSTHSFTGEYPTDIGTRSIKTVIYSNSRLTRAG